MSNSADTLFEFASVSDKSIVLVNIFIKLGDISPEPGEDDATAL